MTLKIKSGKTAFHLLRTLNQLADVDVNRCYQCKKCASGCPVRSMTTTAPYELIRRLQLGDVDRLLDLDLVWQCVACETCYTRCPMHIDTAAIIDALRALAAQKGHLSRERKIPSFNRAFLKTVRMFGRTYDMGLIGGHKLDTFSLQKDEKGQFPFLKDIDKFPMMLAKRKIALFPSVGGNRGRVNRIFQRTIAKRKGA